jgi:type I restriction enzyme S subunit
MKNIARSSLLYLTMPFPPMDEQAAIAKVLSDLDLELAQLRKRLTKTKAVKQGMMQQFLTGRTRLPVKEAVS